MEALMSSNERQRREQISTRIERDALEVIERVALEQRTTASHVARRLLEDAARELARGEARA
jgi:hypothetical protein